MKLDNEMLLLTLNRLQFIPRTISDSARLKEMLHLIDAGGFVIYPKNGIQPNVAVTLEDLTDSQLADLRNKLSPALNLAKMVLAGKEGHELVGSKVREIGLKTYCIKGISCNLCYSIDKYDGRTNKCVEEYYEILRNNTRRRQRFGRRRQSTLPSRKRY